MKIIRLRRSAWMPLLVVASWLSACGSSSPSPVAVLQSTESRNLSPAVPADDATELSTDNQAFAVDLYQALRGQPGNLVFSPTSISIALAMLYNGAANGTATEMAATLHFTLPVDRLNAAFDALDLALTTPPAGAPAGSFQLSLADSIWLQKDFSVLPSFLDALGTSYGAGVDTVDFESAPDDARDAINAWVAAQTQNQIPMLFPAGSIDTSTRLVLANAVYFHGDWLTPFQSPSADGTFHAAAGDVSVPMMSAGSNPNANLWSGTGWQAAALPYVGDAVSMILLVPDAGTFDTFEQGLTADGLATMLGGAAGAFGGGVQMPRFKFSAAESLAATLAALGMPDAFTQAADFSGIDGATDLEVQSVFHQADIAVDEKGTTAAAATGIGVGDAAAIETLVVDRPFLFFIVHQPTGALLFAGRVSDPSASN